MNKVPGQQEKKHGNKKNLISSVIATAAIFLLIIGVTYAWFVNQANITTLVELAPPSKIAIKGPHGKDMISLDLSSEDGEKNDSTVTIRKVISISSTAKKHKLEIIHTTNMEGLTFKLYQAKEETSASTGTVAGEGYNYSYDSKSPIAGEYINGTGVGTNPYGLANDTYHGQNYGTYKNVQSHAEPLYWITDELDAVQVSADQNGSIASSTDDSGETNYLTHYVLEITWQETTKETDIFYLLAENVD